MTQRELQDVLLVILLRSPYSWMAENALLAELKNEYEYVERADVRAALALLKDQKLIINKVAPSGGKRWMLYLNRLHRRAQPPGAKVR